MKILRKMPLKRTDIVAGVIALSLAVLSLMPASWMPASLIALIGGDKVAHVIAYAALGVFALYGRRRFATAFLTGISLLYFGGLLELFQADVGRTSDIADLIANGIGLAIGGMIAGVWKILTDAPSPRPRRA